MTYTFNVPLPDTAAENELGHISDHNAIVDAIVETRTAINAFEPGGSGGTEMVPGDVTVVSPIVKSNVSGNAMTLSAPTAIASTNVIAGTNMSRTINGNDVTLNAVSDPNKMDSDNIIAGANVTVSKGAGQNITISSTATGGGGGGSPNPNIIDVMQTQTWGGLLAACAGDGTTDDAAKIQSAIDYVSSIGGGIVQLSDQHAIGTALVLSGKNVTLQGLGIGQTILSPTAGNTGWVIDVASATYGGEWAAGDTAWSRANDKSGVVIRDLSINGKTRAVAHSGLRITAADNINIQNVGFGYLLGTALQIGGTSNNESVSESIFDNITVMHSGNGVNTPALLMTSGGTGSACSKNIFRNLQFSENKGPLSIVNENTSSWISANTFQSCRVIAESTATYSTVILKGAIRRTMFSNLLLSGSSGTYNLLETQAGTDSRYPRSLSINDVMMHSMSGNGIVVTKCRDISITGSIELSNTVSNKVINLPSGSGIEGYKIDVFTNEDPLNTTPASSAMNFINVDSSVRQNGAVTINGNCRETPRVLIYSGGSYPTRGTDEGQTHLYIGSVDPTATGFVVGVDVWVDTSNG